jgi:hypothetical protein
MGSLWVRDGRVAGPDESRDKDSPPNTTIPTRGIVRIVRLPRLSRTTRVLYKTRSLPIR